MQNGQSAETGVLNIAPYAVLRSDFASQGAALHLDLYDPISGHQAQFTEGELLRISALAIPDPAVSTAAVTIAHKFWAPTGFPSAVPCDAWLQITAVADEGSHFRYAVEVRQTSSPGCRFPAGTWVTGYGSEADQRIRLTTAGTASAFLDHYRVGPAPWEESESLVRVGRLDGLSMIQEEQYGLAVGLGPAESDRPHLVASTQGLKLSRVDLQVDDGQATTLHIDPNGRLRIGTDLSSAETTGLLFDPQQSVLSVRGNLTVQGETRLNGPISIPDGALTAAQASADPAGSAQAVQGNLASHAADTANPHGVTLTQLGAASASDLSALAAAAAAHGSDTENPHAVSAIQVGADPLGSAVAVQALLTAHAGNDGNPHKVTLAQLGAARAEDLNSLTAGFSAHAGNSDNPHSVTLVQLGAASADELNSLAAGFAAHADNRDNPHSVTLIQLGAASADDLNSLTTDSSAHADNRDNPHSVTLVQLGAASADGLNSLTTGFSAHADNRENPHGVTLTQLAAASEESVTALAALAALHHGKADNPHSVTAEQTGAAALAHTHTDAPVGLRIGFDHQAADSSPMLSVKSVSANSSIAGIGTSAWSQTGFFAVNAYQATPRPGAGSPAKKGNMKYLGGQYRGNTRASMILFAGNEGNWRWLISSPGLADGAEIEWSTLLELQNNGAILPKLAGTKWEVLSFNEGWRNRGGGYHGGRYKRFGDLILLSGMVQRVSGASTTVSTLPSECRPVKNCLFPVATRSGSASVEVQRGGEIVVVGEDDTEISLDGIVFSVV